MPEVVVTEKLELDLIRVASYPDSIFKYHLIYKAGNATGMVGVYSFDEEWYYLHKHDTERYKVKRRKDLEGIKPSCIYKQQRKRHIDKQDSQQSLNGKKVKVAEIGDENTQDESPLDMPEQTTGMQMGGM